MTSLDSARETIAIFDRNIAEAQEKTRQHVERLHVAGFSYASEQIKEAWDKCADQIRPIQAARDNLVAAIATIVGMTAPAPIIVALDDEHSAVSAVSDDKMKG